MRMDLKDKYISMIAIAISIIAIAIAILSCESIQIDWVGFVIASLSVLVTLLIGWNIYTFLDIKQISSKVENRCVFLEENTKRDLRKLKMEYKDDFISLTPLFVAVKTDNVVDLIAMAMSVFYDHKDEERTLAKTLSRDFALANIKDMIKACDKDSFELFVEDLAKKVSRPHVEALLSDILAMRVSQRTEKFSQCHELLLTLLLRLD